jgi:hypothetical protein
MSTTTTLTGSVPDSVTLRVLGLLSDAHGALVQAAYEGSHTLRQDPEASYGSPWTTPDLPLDIARELAAVTAALDALNAHAVANYYAAQGVL